MISRKGTTEGGAQAACASAMDINAIIGLSYIDSQNKHARIGFVGGIPGISGYLSAGASLFGFADGKNGTNTSVGVYATSASVWKIRDQHNAPTSLIKVYKA